MVQTTFLTFHPRIQEQNAIISTQLLNNYGGIDCQSISLMKLRSAMYNINEWTINVKSVAIL